MFVAPITPPPSSGVPQGATQNTLVATYNDLANVEELIKGGDIAAVILEPIVGNSGFIQPTQEFLQGCRDLCTKYGTLLVFDEVMTGFRVAYGVGTLNSVVFCDPDPKLKAFVWIV